MSTGLCRSCGLLGGDDEFYSQSRSLCKKCTNKKNRERYHRLYKDTLIRTRRSKNQELKRLPVTHSEVVRAYAAGLIDGEGCVRLTARGKNGGKGFRLGQYTLMVEVTNTDHGMIQWLRGTFGGTVSHTKESYEENRKAKWHWRLAANQALHFLDIIWPYVRTKRKQVKLGRRFQRYAQYTGRAATEKANLLQERFYLELRVLNKRGVR